jgi:2-keto-4-pentenoate hydratase
MLTSDTIEATARAAFDTYRTRTRYRPLDAGLRRAPLDDAYRIQDALHRVMAASGRGEIAGWKIALTSKAMQQMTGVDQPAAGRLLEGRHASPARVVWHLSPPGSRFEVAVRLQKPCRRGGPWTRLGGQQIAACLPAFELVEDSDPATNPRRLHTGRAERGMAAWCSDGRHRVASRRSRRGDALLGQRSARRPGQDRRDGPSFEAVAWLANLLNSRSRRLEPGMIDDRQ